MSMDNELKALLNEHAIPEETITWIQDEGDRSAVGAALKQVWRVCAARNLAALDKLAKGLPVASNDDPLDYDVQKGIVRKFLNFYNWPELDVDEMGCDSLLGQFRRAFEAKSPTMVKYDKAKAIGDLLLRTARKRSRISDFAIIECGSGR